MKFKYFVLFCLLTSFFSSTALCAEKSIEQYNIMLLVDASSHTNSVWEGKSKFLQIRAALSQALDELNKTPSWGLNIGLRIFGDQNPRDRKNCMDHRSGATLEWFEPVLINRILEGIQPKGLNCLSNAIAGTKEDFAVAKENSQSYLLCIVSGRDECTTDEKASMVHLIDELGLEAIYILGANVSKDDGVYFDTIYEDGKGEFVNSTSSEMLAQTITKFLMQQCQGKSDQPQVVEQDVSAPQEKPASAGNVSAK